MIRRLSRLLRAADTRTGTATVVVAVVGAVVVLAAAVIARDLVTVRTGLERARRGADAVLAAAEEGRLGAVAAGLRVIDGEVQRAAAATGGLGWRAAASLPGLQQRLDATEQITTTAAGASTLAVDLVSAIEGLEGPDGTYALRSTEGAIDLDRLTRMAEEVEAVDSAPLQDRLAGLAGSEPAGRLGPFDLGRARARILDLGHRLVGVTDVARTLAAVLPAYLGADEPREYFLAMQNPAELRGTGGLIGFFATVRIEEGRLSLTDPERYEVLDAADQILAESGSRPDVPDGFFRRYDHAQATTFLANANLDPDLPTVATAILHLYEEQRGRELDGVIAMDPIGLAHAHGAIGPITIPAGVPTAGLPNPLPTARLAPVLMVEAYDAFGGPTQARKDYLEAIAESAFRSVVAGNWRPLAMVRALATAAEGGHVQLHSTDSDVQAAFEQLGLAGRLQPPGEGTDLLAVTANNSAGNKSDAHVAHRLGGTIRLSSRGGDRWRRSADLEMTVVNPLGPDSHDLYIVGSSVPNRGFQEAFTGPRGLNRTWFTVWAPDSAEDIVLRRPEGEADDDPYVIDFHGLRAVDYVMETPAETSRSFGVRYAGPAPVHRRGPDRATYRVRLHRQAKAIPDRLDLRIVPPRGWTAVAASATPSTALRLFGPDGALGPPVSAAVEDGDVRISGDLVNPVTVEVTLRAS